MDGEADLGDGCGELEQLYDEDRIVAASSKAVRQSPVSAGPPVVPAQ